MAILFTPTGVRLLILAVILACAAALMAPAARGATVSRVGRGSEATEGPPAQLAVGLRSLRSLDPPYGLVLADEFTWHEFVRFWQRYLGSMGGVVGTVLLVAGLAFLIIMSKGKA